MGVVGSTGYRISVLQDAKVLETSALSELFSIVTFFQSPPGMNSPASPSSSVPQTTHIAH